MDVKFARGTLDKYNALQEKDEGTVYMITKDVSSSVSGENVAGKTFMGETKIGDTETNGLYLDSDIKVLGTPKFGLLNENDVIPAGTSVTDVLKMMMSKELNPANATQPSISLAIGGGFSAAGNVEVGSTVNWGNVTASTSVGRYNNNGWTSPAQPSVQGVSFSNFNVTRTVTGFEGSLNNIKVVDASASVGNFADTQTGLTIGEGTFTVTYSGSADNTKASNYPIKNTGVEYTVDDNCQIKAGNRTANASRTWTGQRKYFAGCLTDIPGSLDSATVRGLSISSLNPIAGTKFTISMPVGTKAVIITYPATIRDLNEVTSQALGGASIKDSFIKGADVQVEGANGFAAIAYKSYMWSIPAGAAGADTLTVTI